MTDTAHQCGGTLSNLEGTPIKGCQLLEQEPAKVWGKGLGTPQEMRKQVRTAWKWQLGRHLGTVLGTKGRYGDDWAAVDFARSEKVMERERDRERIKDGLEKEREALKHLAKEPLTTDQYADSSCLTMQRVAEAFKGCLLTPV